MNTAFATDDALSEDALAKFNTCGYILARGFFSAAETSEISGWIDELLARPETPGAHWIYRQPHLLEPGRQVVQRLENFSPHHEQFDRLLRDSKLSRAVAQMLDGPVLLFKEKVNFKEPGGAGFELHQDQQAGWSRYAPLFITATVCIDPATRENGCLELAEGPRSKRMIAEEWRPINQEEAAALTLQPVPMQPGDVLFFDSFFPHSSKDNLTSARRRMLFATYNGAAYGDVREQYHRDKRANFPPDVERVAGAQYQFRV
jgi:ectoine hydroxylase-related dioxygenase (phytanoyl-CoA dioxygenase family)